MSLDWDGFNRLQATRRRQKAVYLYAAESNLKLMMCPYCRGETPFTGTEGRQLVECMLCGGKFILSLQRDASKPYKGFVSAVCEPPAAMPIFKGIVIRD